MAEVHEIGPYSAYAIAVKYGYQGTEEEWVQEQEANRKAAASAAAAAAQSAKDAAASASGAAQSGQQAVQSIKDAQTSAEQAIDTAKQQAVQAAKAEAEKAATSAGQAASSAAEAAQSATNAAAEVGKVQSAGTSAVQAVQAAQNTATGAVSDAQQTATQAVSKAQTTAVSAVQEAGTTQTGAVASAGTAALKGISDAKDAALSSVAEAGAAQVSTVETVGTNAVEDVNDAKTTALKEIEDANAALPNPTQSDAGKVPTVKADGTAYELAGPYAPLSAAIRPTASGNPVSITDSVEWPLQGLKVYGKSTQDGTPSPENPVPIISAGEGGSVEIGILRQNILSQWRKVGTSDWNQAVSGVLAWVETDVVIQSGKTYYVAFYKNGIFLPENNNECYINTINSASGAIDARSGKFVATKTGPLFIRVGDSLQSATYDKFEIALTPIYEYLPYASQSLTISTPNGLPGISVASGGNYTDANGQQRVCDEIDYAHDVYVQRVATFVIYSSYINYIETAKESVNTFAFPTNLLPSPAISARKLNGNFGAVLCNIAPPSKSDPYTSNEVGCGYTLNSNFLRINMSNNGVGESIESFKEYLDGLQASGTPAKILYIIDTPIETPLFEEEIAAHKALHTYDGATVVSTAEDVAGLEVKYLADGEKYVERIVSQKAPEAAAAHTMALLADGIREGVNGV